MAMTLKGALVIVVGQVEQKALLEGGRLIGI